MSISFLQPPELFQSAHHGMSQVAVARGRLVIVSGQVALDAEGNFVGEGDFEAQAIQAFENVKAALAAAGAGLADVPGSAPSWATGNISAPTVRCGHAISPSPIPSRRASSRTSSCRSC